MSNRKSSVGVARRVAQKPHVPYRADDLAVGKRTGVTVDRVDRKSDGMEPFQDVLDLMDRRSPPRAKNTGRRKKRVTSPTVDNPEDELDENGEMTMELTDTPPGPGYAMFTNDRRPNAPDSMNRVASSSRRPARVSEVDFDKVPSPRPSGLSKRQSLANGSAQPLSAMSQSFVPSSDPAGDIDDDDGFDDLAVQDNAVSDAPSPRKASLAQIDQDEEEIDNDGDPMLEDSPIRPKKNKGKQKAQSPEGEDDDQAHGIEDEIVQGLDEVELGADEEDAEEDEPRNSKLRAAHEKPKGLRGRPRKRKITQDRDPTPEGIRRSRRHRYAPLEWWRLEKVVYGKPDSGAKVHLPHIREIVRIPRDPVQPLGKYKRKRSAAPPSISKAVETPVVGEQEEGWDHETEQQGVVMDFFTREEMERRVAYTSKMVTLKAAANDEWFFQKIFSDGDFIAAGQLMIPPKSNKPSKGTKDNTYVFYVIEGAITVRIHSSTKVLTTGGMFIVPRGNTYFIENISDRNAKLFFAQARRTIMSEEEQASTAKLLSAPRRSSESQRPSSRPPAGAGPSSDADGVKVNGRVPSSGPVAGTSES